MKTMEEAEARVKNRTNQFKDRLGVRWAITLQESPKDVIGSCGFFIVRRGTQTVEIGYDLHPDFWNNGLMTEVLREMVRFSFCAWQPGPGSSNGGIGDARKHPFHSRAGEAQV